MAIRASSARDVDALLQQLRSPAGVDRDAAIARLRIIGARAHERVLALIADASAGTDVRVAALKVIDSVDEPRLKRAAISATADPDPAVASAAVHVLRTWLSNDEGTSALEAVTALVADATRPSEVRRAALDALSDLPASLIDPLVQNVAAQLSPTPPLTDAATATEWLAGHEDAPLGVIHDLVIHARDRGRDAQDPGAWLALRAAAHAALARRGSRLALYDVRDLFEQARAPLPLDLLVTMRTIGDLSCLDALARAWETVADDAWWREQVRETAGAIVTREKATSRNPIVKRVRAKRPGFLA